MNHANVTDQARLFVFACIRFVRQILFAIMIFAGLRRLIASWPLSSPHPASTAGMGTAIMHAASRCLLAMSAIIRRLTTYVMRYGSRD